MYYNISSRAAQSNLVYVSVLKISIVHANSVSKSLRQKFFFSRERPLLARGKRIYFATIMDTNRGSAHQSQNEDNFPTFSLRARVLKCGRKREKQRKRRLREQSLLISLSVFRVGFDAQHHRPCYKTIGSCTQEARVALGYCLGQLLRFFRALQTSHVLHNSIVHAKA